MPGFYPVDLLVEKTRISGNKLERHDDDDARQSGQSCIKRIFVHGTPLAQNRTASFKIFRPPI